MIIAKFGGLAYWVDASGRPHAEGGNARDDGWVECAFIRRGELHALTVGGRMYVYGDCGIIFEILPSGNRFRVNSNPLRLNFSRAEFRSRVTDGCYTFYNIYNDTRCVITFTGDAWSTAIERLLYRVYDDGERIWMEALSGSQPISFVCSDSKYNFNAPFTVYHLYGTFIHDARRGRLLYKINHYHHVDSAQYYAQLMILCSITRSIIWTMHTTELDIVDFALFASDNVIVLTTKADAETSIRRHYCINIADGSEYDILFCA